MTSSSSVVPGDSDALADRILAGPVPACHGVVDDDPAFRVGGIELVEQPPFQQRHAHGLQVLVRDDAHVGHRFKALRRLGLADDLHRRRRPEP